MKKMLCLMLSAALVVSCTAQAKLSTEEDSPSKIKKQTEILGSMPYMEVLPQLRTTAGAQGSSNISALNEAYTKLKAQGVREPTLQQVIDRLQADRGLDKTADNNTLIICAVAGAMVLNTVGAVYFSKWLNKQNQPPQGKAGGGKDCQDKVSQVIQRSSGSQSAEAKTKRAVQ